MEEVIRRLSDLYPHVKFVEGNESGNKILLYNDRELMWDEEFSDNVLELAEKFLDEDEYNSFAYVYDFLDEMSATLENESQAEFKVIKRFEIRDYRVTLEKRCEENEMDVISGFNKVNNIFALSPMALLD